MGLLAHVLFAAVLSPQEPATRTAPALRPLVPEVVVAPSPDPVPLAEFGLGDGGTGAVEPASMRWIEGGCTTPGGVRIECRAAGVKLTFPSGRELLVAPDGRLHLRSGEVAGPYASGLELRLGDGASVRIVLAPGARERLRNVHVVADERAVQPWRRGAPATFVDRPGPWAGVRIACCGDGGDLYRAIALGPLVVLERVLVADDRAAAAPEQRLVLLTAPLRQSLAAMPRQHTETDVAVRRAVAAVAAVADRADAIFPAALHRAAPDRLRWLLRGGFELQLDLEGPLAPRLGLCAGGATFPMVEWTLGPAGAAFLGNPRDDPSTKRWHGNGTRLVCAAPELQAKEHLNERAAALRVVARLRD